MMEGEDTGWLSELEKKGLQQAAGILENYGIASETDVSLIVKALHHYGQVSE